MPTRRAPRLPAALHFAHYFRLEGFRNRLRSILNGRDVRSHKRLRRGVDESFVNLGWLPLIGLLLPVANVPIQQSASQPGAAPTRSLPRLAVEDSSQIDAPRLLEAARALSMPIAVRVRASLAAEDLALEEKLASYRRAGIPMWVTVPAPASVQDAEKWRQALTGLLERYGDGIAILEIAIDREQAQLGGFAAQACRYRGEGRPARDSHGHRRNAG